MKLDYTLTTPQQRIEYVNEIISKTPDIKPNYLNYMADYILFVGDKNQTKKERKTDYPITTKNRQVTIEKRQVSYEELVSTLENGEDGVYNMIANDKNQILDPRSPITQEDIDNIFGIKEKMEQIETLKQSFEKAIGIDRFYLKKQIIETWQEIYLLKASASGKAYGRKSKAMTNPAKNLAHRELPEDIHIDPETKIPYSKAPVSLLNPNHVSYLLCNYSLLKEECGEDLQSDMHFLLIDLEDLAAKVLEDSPFFWDILCWKVDGLSNQEIIDLAERQYGEVHAAQYYSTIWRKRIPRLIAEQAQKDYLIWHYTNVEKGNWIHCSKCGEYKPANPMFFAKNSSKTGYYSICKDCKNKRGKRN